MPEVIGVKAQVSMRAAEAVRRVSPRDFDIVDPAVRRSERADFQAAIALDLANRTGSNPRELAAAIKAELVAPHAGLDESEGQSPDGSSTAADGGVLDSAGVSDPIFESVEVSGPGFLNLTVADRVLWSVVAARLADDRLGFGVPLAGSHVLVDYSGPNIAKELHVGHLRSTVIGDALVRILTHAGAEVIKANHLGDWGTQFGRLIQYLLEHPEALGSTPGTLSTGAPDPDPAAATAADPQPSCPALDGMTLADLDAVYKAATAEFAADPAFAERARNRVVALQNGEPTSRAVWTKLVELSTSAFQDIYRRLGVLLTPADAVPESFYNPMLADVVAELDRKGLIKESDGALCVFSAEFKDPQGEPLPLLVRKSDGGYGYAATDLAALRYRVEELKAQRILYVTDSRQALHLRMVFSAARRTGWLGDEVDVAHIAFGTMLGADGKPFRSRSGDTPHLVDLLDKAVAEAGKALEERSPHFDPGEFESVVQAAGIGAIKFADLSNMRIKDYVFDPARMVSSQGRTGVYLQYAHARVNSVLGKLPEALRGGADGTGLPLALDAPLSRAERALILALDEFGEVVEEVTGTLEPHRLCTYLFDVAKAWSDFWENCPILKADADGQRVNRAALAHLTGRTLRQGLELLGIDAPARI
ncbi:arginine--tRNA ligase [Actinospica robiniae]|uniref:arginine--tRNA ligase n=1 Tax=Actinospica robiniae TaxID=304901 RepID=UPI0004251A72|nr:arginine--tRNA ligase [Actinospica robiniae]